METAIKNTTTLITPKIAKCYNDLYYFYGMLPFDINVKEVSKIHILFENEKRDMITPCLGACDKQEFKKGTYVHIVARQIDGKFDAVHFFSDELFPMILVQTKTFVQALNKMTELLSTGADRAEQVELFSSTVLSGKAAKPNPIAKGRLALNNKFTLIKDMLPDDVVATIEGWFDKPSNASRDARKTDYYLNCSPNYKYRPKAYNPEEIHNYFDKEIYGLENVKEVLCGKIMHKAHTRGARGNKILFVASSGTGKTVLAHTYAQATGLPISVLDLAMCSSSLELKGCSSNFDGSDAGHFIRSAARVGTTEMVFILENLDQLQNKTDKDGNPMSCMLSVLSPDKVIRDAYLDGIPVSVEHTDFIATAKTVENIPKSILDQFTVITLQSYTFIERVNIAKSVILPRIIETVIDKKDIEVTIDDDILEYIARNYCSDDGVGDLTTNLSSIVESVASSFFLHNEIPEINRAFVDKLIGFKLKEYKPGLTLNRYYDDFLPETVNEIRKTITRVNSPLISDAEKGTEQRRLDYLLKLRKTTLDPVDINGFTKAINESHYGMDNVKEPIIEAFKTQGKFGSIRSMLLVGPAGTGKTTLSRSIAKACGKDFRKISLNAVTHENHLRGFEKTWKDADAGEIIKSITSSSSNIIILMDEVDKLKSDMVNCALDLIDEYVFNDKFLGVPVDLSNVIFLFTANNMSQISPYLLDRFDVIINVDGYGRKDKTEIINTYIIPEINKKYGLNVSIDNEACEKLINEYSFTNGVRDIKRKIHSIVRHLISKTDLDEIIISSSDIESYFEKPLPRGNVPCENNESGVSLGLAISGSEGIVFPVETTLIPNDSSLTVTGLAGEDVTESAKLCATYIRSHYEKLRDVGIHVHYGEGAVKKSGSSAGVTTMISMLSAAFEIPVSYDYAYTGEIDLKGNVFAIGGIEKLEAAVRQGCKTVFIPRDNYDRWKKDNKLDEFSIEIIPVTHVSEVIKRVLPEIELQNRITK